MSEQTEIHVEIGPLLEDRLRRIEQRLGLSENFGKGEVLPALASVNYHAKIIEALQQGSLREQWTRPVNLPFKPTASLLNYVKQTGAIQGALGDVVQIPLVKPFDAEVLASVGNSWTAAITGAYSTTQTTLYEAGGYMEIPYADIEKLSEELLAEIEAQFQNAIVRTIDAKIFTAVAGTANLPYLDKTSASAYFDVDWIPEALHKILTSGREANPQDFFLCITPLMYADLFKDVVGSQSIMYARPDIIRDGIITELMGVKILISNNLPTHTTNSYWAFLINKNSIVFAPKREMLFELEKDTVNRKVKLTGSYTFGFVVADKDSICGVKTKTVS
ncbi:MAG: hypothetical protein QXD19_00180 [Candidatus Bathyarchaeia archaeon]